MEFNGTTRQGTYCLKVKTSSCTHRDYKVDAGMRTSVDGWTGNICTLNETRKTCEAHLDGIDYKSCTSDNDCGAAGLDDGKCVGTYCAGYCDVMQDCWTYAAGIYCGANNVCSTSP